MGNRAMGFKVLFLLAVGFLQMAGDCLHLPWMSRAGLAIAASPCPRVFCRINNTETFASNYFLEWTDRLGQSHDLALGPGTVDRIPGPLARRSMYLCTLSGEGTVENSMAWSAKRYGLCGPLLAQMGINRADIRWPARLRIVTPGASLFPVVVSELGGDCP